MENSTLMEAMDTMEEQNQTDFNNLPRTPPYSKLFFIVCESILGLLTIFAIYVFINIVHYTVVRKRSPGRDVSGKQSRQLHIMCIIASGTAVLRFISDHTVAFVGSTNDENCLITITVSTVFYALSILSVYIFLWMRQSIFYANPVLSKVLNKGITFLSWSTLVVMLLSGVCLTVLYNMPNITGWMYEATDEGCMEISLASSETELVPSVTVATIVYFQLSLLALFLYPLLSRKTQRYRSAGKATGTRNEAAGANNSVSNNTDDNLTDGDLTGSNSVQSPIIKSKFVIVKNPKPGIEIESENESGVDMQGPSDKSESSTCGTTIANVDICPTCNDIKDGLPDMTESNDSTRLKEVKQKRPSIFANTKFFKNGSLFYRRHQTKLGQVPQSPTAKRTRAKTVPMVTTNPRSEDESKDRKMSNGSNKSERKKKMRRHTKRTQQGRRMMAYLKKSFYLMIVCVVTDVIATVLQAVAEVPELVYLVIFDLSLMVNIICIILTFRDWDIMLFPLCAKNSGRNSSFETSKTSMKADINAARRRAETLRIAVAQGNSIDSDLNSPAAIQYHRNRLGTDAVGSFSTPKQTQSTLQSCLVKKNVNLNGKT